MSRVWHMASTPGIVIWRRGCGQLFTLKRHARSLSKIWLERLFPAGWPTFPFRIVLRILLHLVHCTQERLFSCSIRREKPSWSLADKACCLICLTALGLETKRSLSLPLAEREQSRTKIDPPCLANIIQNTHKGNEGKTPLWWILRQNSLPSKKFFKDFQEEVFSNGYHNTWNIVRPILDDKLGIYSMQSVPIWIA